MNVRVRFAPSPTGPLHLGNARTAVLNYLFAKRHGGAFILRIEDTDRERFDPTSEALISKELRWLGITPDEGPLEGGTFGPYRQSDRLRLYMETAERLLLEGHAFRCYCTDEVLELERKKALARNLPPRYSGKCRNLTPEEIEKRGGMPHAIRFLASDKAITVHDVIRGDVVFPPDAFGDFVIIRTDRFPVYNFSSVVDDRLMKITHIIRGEDHLSNTPRQVLLYEALGETPPLFAHHPLLLSPSGEKISKREKGASLEDFIDEGYTPEAVFNYLAAIGNPGVSGKEIHAIDELSQAFELASIGKAGVRIDPSSIRRMSARHLQRLGGEEILQKAEPFLVASGFSDEFEDRTRLLRFIDAVKENVSALSEIPRFAPIFFQEIPPMEAEALLLLREKSSQSVLGIFLKNLGHLSTIREAEYHEVMKKSLEETTVKGRQFFAPLRAAITGALVGPELLTIVTMIGLETVRKRITRALDEAGKS